MAGDIYYDSPQPEQKYYWLSAATHENGKLKSVFEQVLDEDHPFSYIIQQNAPLSHYERVTLLNWKEIEKWEYDLFNA